MGGGGGIRVRRNCFGFKFIHWAKAVFGQGSLADVKFCPWLLLPPKTLTTEVPGLRDVIVVATKRVFDVDIGKNQL